MEALNLKQEAALQELEDAARVVISECIAVFESKCGELSADKRDVINNLGLGFFFAGARFAMQKYDCYPKT